LTGIEDAVATERDVTARALVAHLATVDLGVGFTTVGRRTIVARSARAVIGVELGRALVARATLRGLVEGHERSARTREQGEERSATRAHGAESLARCRSPHG